jgi:cell shape-determining protein MreC
MNYHQKNSTHIVSWKYVFSLIVLTVALVSVRIYRPVWFSGFMRVFSPIWSIRDTTINSVRSSYDFLSFQKHLVSENEALKQENETLKVQLNSYKAIEEQHNTLLGLPSSYTPLKIISRPPFTPHDLFIVNLPIDTRVSLGDSVYGARDTVIGTVTAVSSRTATVTLFSSSGVSREGYILRTKETVSVKGSSNGAFDIYVPKDVDVVEGDTVIDSITTSPLGVVVSIASDLDGSFKHVYVRSVYSFSRIEWLYIHSSL